MARSGNKQIGDLYPCHHFIYVESCTCADLGKKVLMGNAVDTGGVRKELEKGEKVAGRFCLVEWSSV